ncbi:MAG: PD-(D/E)XK motif protein [Thermodesulfobacteriota bacterium]
MNNGTPWDEIRIPSADYNVRLVAGSGSIPVYWGRDADGHCLLLVELDGDHSTQFRKDAVRLQGIRLDLRQGEAVQQRLVLTLEKHVDQDLFSGLCGFLIGALTPIADSATALSVALAHIKRWKAFFAGRKTRLLSPEEIRGLFAELLFLRSLYQGHLPEKSSVEAWCGVEGLHQDFIFGNTAVEIKSLSGKERNTVHISSEDQLEGLSDHLFLMIFRLSDMPDSDRSLSLNDAVHRIENELTDAEGLEDFYAKLAAYGYVPVQEYDLPKLQVTSKHSYRVTQNFPRLVRAHLPEGVTRVSYEIELEKLSQFEVDPEQIFRR